MNKDQVKGTIKDVAGQVQQKVGEVTGSKEQQIKGLAKQIEGKTEKSIGNFKQAVGDADKGKH